MRSGGARVLPSRHHMELTQLCFMDVAFCKKAHGTTHNSIHKPFKKNATCTEYSYRNTSIDDPAAPLSFCSFDSNLGATVDATDSGRHCDACDVPSAAVSFCFDLGSAETIDVNVDSDLPGVRRTGTRIQNMTADVVGAAA